LINDIERARNILKKLKEVFGRVNEEEFLAYKVAFRTRDPFETLIATILTQNTNERNAFRSYYSLKREFKIKPETLAVKTVKEVSSLISHGGLGSIKAKRIIEASKYVLETYKGNLWSILKKPLEEARKELLKIPGVGPKTADILLLMIANKPTVPVDTHVMRVSSRLGFVKRNAKYEDVRKALINLYCPDKCLEAHLYLILLGRKYCLSRKPRCHECPIANLCPKIC